MGLAFRGRDECGHGRSLTLYQPRLCLGSPSIITSSVHPYQVERWSRRESRSALGASILEQGTRSPSSMGRLSTVHALHTEIQYIAVYVYIHRRNPPRATAEPPVINTTPPIPNSHPLFRLLPIDDKQLSHTSNLLNPGIGPRLVRRLPIHLTAHQPLTNPRTNKLALIPMALRRSPSHTSPKRRRRQLRPCTLPAIADGQFRLEGGGVDAVCAEALVDVLRRLDEGRDGLVGYDNVD